MWKIKELEIPGKVVLGPMAGITNVAYRRLMKPFGVSLCYTEMVSDCGLIYHNEETFRYLVTEEEERPVGIQLFGGTKETLLKGLMVLKETKAKYDFIDVNLGCPVHKVTKTGAGSAWLKRPQELYEMMKEFVSQASCPVTAKIRIGWDFDSINYRKVIQLLEQAGVAMIAIHTRTRAELYGGKAHHDWLKNIRQEMHVPLVISGDIFTLEDAIAAQRITGADGIMVARGSLGNPYLITQIERYFATGEKLPKVSLIENLSYLKRHYLLLKELKGEKVAIQEMRGIAPHYLKGYADTKAFRMQLATQIKDESDFFSLLSKIEKKEERI